METQLTRSRRIGARRGRRLLVAALAGCAGLTTIGVATSLPASASTVNGTATIASPGTTTELPSGGSTTQFTVSLPPQAACDGDTATDGYHVYSYLLPLGTALSGVTFEGAPNKGLGLFAGGTYYGPVNTAIGTGQIVGIPNDFDWAPIITNNYIPLTGSGGLLYTGSGSSASGIWNAGIVCANSSGVPVDNWNTEVTFLASSTDANGFVWTAVPGSGTAPAITSASSVSFAKGFAGSFTPSASGTPTPTITESGTLPAGLTFSGGVLSGTPTTVGSSTVTLTAKNGVGPAVTQSLTINVTVLAVTTTSLPAATLGGSYSATVSAEGGTAPYKWKNSPKLPKGLKLNKTTGAITGTVSSKATPGSYPITFTVEDHAKPKDTASATLTLTVNS